MPRWDFKCPSCGDIIEVTYPSLEAAKNDPPVCLWCYAEGDGPPDNPYVMQRQPARSTFVVNGFNAKNGYGK